jgi:uncharacterized protein (DUF1330 family)
MYSSPEYAEALNRRRTALNRRRILAEGVVAATQDLRTET